MKARKFLAGLAMTVIVLFGAFSPVVDIVMHGHPKIASAQASEPICGLTDMTCSMVKFTVNILSSPFIAMATIGGLVLDYSIWTTVSSDSYTDKDGIDSFVVRGWKLVRDFSNLVFIFGLFVAAFVLILGKSEGGESLYNPKRLVARVLIMALFINFSFFMCRSIIDVTNLVARAFYTQISTDNDATSTNEQQTIEASAEGNIDSVDLGNVSGIYSHKNLIGIRSVSLGILSKIQLQDLILKAGGGDAFSNGNYGQILITYFMVALFNGFLAFLFLSSAIFLISRTIGLWFLMILSPIAFASRVIPALQKKEYFGWDDWFSQFVGLASSVVVYLFFIYLAVVFLNVRVNDVVDSTSNGFLAVTFAVGIKLLSVGIVLTLGKTVAKDLSGKIGAMAAGAVNSAIVGGAMVVGAAATGGAAGVLQMGRRYASERAKSAGVGIGNSIVGEEATAEFQKRWGTGGIKNFNPLTMQGRKAISKVMEKRTVEEGSMGAMSRSISGAYRSGGVANRLFDIKQAKEAEEKAKIAKASADKVATKDIDKKIEDIKKAKENGELTNKEYEEKYKELVLQKKEILNPSAKEQRAVNDAKKAADEAAKNNTTQGKEIDSKLAANQKSISDTEKAIADSTSKMAAAAQKMVDAGNKKQQAATDIARKSTEIKDQQDSFSQQNQVISQQKSQFTAQKMAAEQDLADTEKELAALPKVGFGVDRQKITDLEQKRQQHLANKQIAEAGLGQADQQSSVLSASHSTTLAALQAEHAASVAKEQSAAAEETNAATEEKTLANNKKKAEDSKTNLESQQQDLAKQKTSLAEAITAADAAHSTAKSALDSKKEELKLVAEKQQRQRTEKTDTDNRRRNADRIQQINDRLKIITSGGTPPPTP